MARTPVPYHHGALRQALIDATEALLAEKGADGFSLREQGIEYVRYAMDHPGRFRLMFRSGQLHKDAALEHQGTAAFDVLARGVRRVFGVEDAASMTPEHWNAVTALWALVHGYAHLAIAGKLDPLCHGQGLKTFVAGSLGPILTAMIAGLTRDAR